MNHEEILKMFLENDPLCGNVLIYIKELDDDTIYILTVREERTILTIMENASKPNRRKHPGIELERFLP